MIRIGILGADGRMGHELIKEVTLLENTCLSAAIVPSFSKSKGLSVNKVADDEQLTKIIFTDNLTTELDKIDVLIDFSVPEATLEHLAIASKKNIAIVIGTTGFSELQKEKITQYAQQMPIILSPNMSIGVNVVYELLALAAQALSHTDIEIIEMHHRHKVDAPSGTALKLGEVIADTLGRDLKTDAIFGREGKEGPRAAKTIGFSTIRGGDVVGDHTVIFADIGERIEITHKASSRATFAKGAVKAAIWLYDKPHGMYDMKAVLGFK